ncbi:DUF6268 family outer membrane beta-barrel protein [Flavobacterium sp. KACC 22761]|uniref:DUF6268 family outer membrane beta-barrel protein n=1 Tax=Flavobacterium sp. KACC 22761 TaxID=3092665 RepID=UPI002A75920B|nr:DUF6268 family outer membrane beta-barrel protein [Flavobacterium sp. KACC 22761]WPO80766.1 DUF6268 family outer membrane beta-barrel protein [Flavobacterium sp. KACC 22761]
MKAQETFSANVNLKTEPTDKIDFNESGISVVFNKKINPKNQIINTTEYSKLNINYDLDPFSELENLDRFNQFHNKTEYSFQAWDKTKLKFSLTPMFSFQQHLDASDFTILGSFEINQQLNSNTTISIGVARSSIFGNPKFIPVTAINYNLSEKSTISVGFPDTKISYSNNIRNKFSLTNSFNGSFYNLDQKSDSYFNASKMSLSQMTSAFEYERNVDGNWFMNFKAGYDFNKNYKLTDSENHTMYNFNTSNGYILGIGIKYKQ